MAIGIREGFVDVVHATRAADMPEIFLCASFRKERSDSATLAQLRKELKLDHYHCTTLLKTEDYQLHQVEALNVPAPELKSAMRWRIKDLLDYPVDAATIDVLDIPVDPNASARNHSMYAITARNSVIASCIKPFNDAHVPLEVIDIPDLAQRNIAQLFETQGRGIAMLAFYETGGLLTFTSGGELYVARRIDVSLPHLTAAEGEERTHHFERIALELQRSLDHLDSQYRYVEVAKLLLAPLPQDIGLNRYLAQNLHVPVEVLDLAEVASFKGVPELNQPTYQAHYLPSIGAALRGPEAR